MSHGHHREHRVAEIASAIPSSVRIFQRHGIDFCCGGKTSLAVACRERGVSFPEIARTIEASIESGTRDERDWTREPLHVLVDHIVATYHEPLREELPRLESMAAKVSRVHGSKAPYLSRVEALLMELSADLHLHMQKEERMLFPAIRAIERGQPSGDADLQRRSASWSTNTIGPAACCRSSAKSRTATSPALGVRDVPCALSGALRARSDDARPRAPRKQRAAFRAH